MAGDTTDPPGQRVCACLRCSDLRSCEVTTHLCGGGRVEQSTYLMFWHVPGPSQHDAESALDELAATDDVGARNA